MAIQYISEAAGRVKAGVQTLCTKEGASRAVQVVKATAEEYPITTRVAAIIAAGSCVGATALVATTFAGVVSTKKGREFVTAAVQTAMASPAAQALKGRAEENPLLAGAAGALAVSVIGPATLAGAAACAIPTAMATEEGREAVSTVVPLPADWRPPSPPSAPKPQDWTRVLDEMKAAANRGLEGAKALGVKPNGAASLHKEIIDSTKTPPLIHADRFPDALDPQSRADKTQWDVEEEKGRDLLCKDATAFAALSLLADWSGVEKFPQPRLLNLAGKIGSGREKRSPWEVFLSERKNLTLFQRLKAGFAYLLFYQTALIHRIVHIHVNHHLKELSDTLATSNPQNHAQLFHKVLQHGNGFFAGELKAAEAFANGTPYPDLKDHDLNSYRFHVIKGRYGSLDQLCREASARKLGKNPPKVPFFTFFHKIPLLSALSKGLESAINRFIQRKLKGNVLPDILKSGVENITEEAEPHKLRFAIAAAELLTSIIEKARREFSNLGKEDSQLAVSPVNQQDVATFAKHLVAALDLKGLETAALVKQQLEEQLQKPAGGWERAVNFVGNLFGKGVQPTVKGEIDKELVKVLEVSIFEGVHKLFSHFHKMAKSRELSAQLQKLAGELFSTEEIDPKELYSRYVKAQAELNDVSADLFDQIAEQALKELTGGDSEESADTSIQGFFERTKVITQETVKSLRETTKNLPDRAKDPSTIQTDLATLFHILKEFSTSQKLRSDLNCLKQDQKERFWAAFTPMYQEIEEVASRAAKLQTAQDLYVRHTEVAENFERIPSLISSRERFGELARTKDAIVRCLERPGIEVAANTKITEFVAQVQTNDTLICKEQGLIDACAQLSSCLSRWSEAQKERNGTLFARFLRPLSRRYTNEQFREEARTYIALLPESEREPLKRAINDASNPESIGNAQAIITRISEAAVKAQKTYTEEQQACVNQTVQWTTEAAQQYRQRAEQNLATMTEQSQAIERLVQGLTHQAQKVTLPNPAEKSASEKAGRKILVGFFAYDAISGNRYKTHLKERLHQIGVKMRLYSHDPLLFHAAATRFISEMG